MMPNNKNNGVNRALSPSSGQDHYNSIIEEYRDFAHTQDVMTHTHDIPVLATITTALTQWVHYSRLENHPEITATQFTPEWYQQIASITLDDMMNHQDVFNPLSEVGRNAYVNQLLTNLDNLSLSDDLSDRLRSHITRAYTIIQALSSAANPAINLFRSAASADSNALANVIISAETFTSLLEDMRERQRQQTVKLESGAGENTSKLQAKIRFLTQVIHYSQLTNHPAISAERFTPSWYRQVLAMAINDGIGSLGLDHQDNQIREMYLRTIHSGATGGLIQRIAALAELPDFAAIAALHALHNEAHPAPCQHFNPAGSLSYSVGATPDTAVTMNFTTKNTKPT